jgi:hypothetical protein
MTHHRISAAGRRSRFWQLVLGAAVLVPLWGVPSPALAQKKAAPTAGSTIEGKLAGIEKKGRSFLVTVETSTGEKIEFPLTAKVDFAVTGKGDVEFLRTGQTVSTTAVMSNDLLFGKEFTVHVGPGTKPKAVYEKAPPKIGQSVNAYVICGTIVTRQQDQEYKDYETILVRVGTQTGKVYLDKGFTVIVRSADPALAKVGSDVELEGTFAGSRFTPTKATVKLAEAFKSEDFGDKSSKGKKAAD